MCCEERKVTLSPLSLSLLLLLYVYVITLWPRESSGGCINTFKNKVITVLFGAPVSIFALLHFSCNLYQLLFFGWLVECFFSIPCC